VSPSRKRAAVGELQSQFTTSERRACVVLDQPRSSQRYQSQPRDDEAALLKRMLELVRERPRYGYRRIAALLRAERWRASPSRILRLWRREGLKVPRKKRKRRRLGKSENGCHRRRAESRDHVWCWDFVFDRTTSGSPLKWLSIVDEYTRECLALKVDRSITSEDVIDSLAELFAMRCVPRHIRSDNGPEFIAHAIRRWLGQVGVETLYIEPGSPWENGFAESFHSRLRDEFLAMEVFESLRAARQLTAAWREDYNHYRPHGSLGYVAPVEFARRCAASAASLTSATPQPSSSLQQHSEVSPTPTFITSGIRI
jgi:putative transposase